MLVFSLEATAKTRRWDIPRSVHMGKSGAPWAAGGRLEAAAVLSQLVCVQV